MSVSLYLGAGLLGLLLGSFFNVVGLRLPKQLSISYPPSHCPHCQRRLGIAELIPVLSYFILRGRCRACSMKISPLYPLVEASTGFLFVLAAYQLGWSMDLFYAWTLISLCMIIVVTDLTYLLIPDKILLFFASLFLGWQVFFPFRLWLDALGGALLGFGLLLLIAVLSRGGMGGGDIKLFALLGFVLGWQGVLLTLFLSSLYGTLLAGIGLFLGKVERGKPLAFGRILS